MRALHAPALQLPASINPSNPHTLSKILLNPLKHPSKVFLERQFAEFRTKEDADTMIGILRKTWVKMSERGHAAALTLPMGEAEAALVGKALAG
jgi:hypothetical protein